MIRFTDANGLPRLLNPMYIIEAGPNAKCPEWTDVVLDEDSGDGTPVIRTIQMPLNRLEQILSWNT